MDDLQRKVRRYLVSEILIWIFILVLVEIGLLLQTLKISFSPQLFLVFLITFTSLSIILVVFFGISLKKLDYKRYKALPNKNKIDKYSNLLYGVLLIGYFLQIYLLSLILFIICL